VIRTYSTDLAPLKRVRFRVGDKIKTQAGSEFIVKEALEQNGLRFCSERIFSSTVSRVINL
jgi:hypothetical protein